MMRFSDIRIRAENFIPGNLQLEKVEVLKKYDANKTADEREKIGYSYTVGSKELYQKFTVRIEGEAEPVITNEDLHKQDEPVYVELINGFIGFRHQDRWSVALTLTADKVRIVGKDEQEAPPRRKRPDVTGATGSNEQ